MPNIHELRARRAKAEAIVAKLVDTLSPAQRTDPQTVRIFRECESQRVRDLIADEAGQKSPSDETWTLAGNILAQRVRDARWGAGLTERAG